jgi:hypothetical protein
MAVQWWDPAVAERIYGTVLVHRARQRAYITSLTEFCTGRGRQ